MTVTGVAHSLRAVNRATANGKETVHERVPDSKSYEMGMQIARGIYSDVSAHGAVWTVAQLPGRRVSGMSPTERESSRRRTLAGRSGASAAGASAHGCGGPGGRISQRQERDPHCPHVGRTRAELCGGTFLGAGGFCLDGGPRRGGGTPLPPSARGRGPTARAPRGVQEGNVSARSAGSWFDRVCHRGWLMKT